MKWTAVIPTYCRHQHFNEHVEWILNTEPSPEKVLVTHPENETTDKFDFASATQHSSVDVIMIENDRGLIHSKFQAPWDLVPTDMMMIFDDDIFPSVHYPNNVIESYKQKQGVYCGIGFRYSESSFKDTVYGGTWEFDNYVKENKITLVDSPGQSFAFCQSDIGMPTESLVPDDVYCNRCMDDHIIGKMAWDNGLGSYTVPHSKDKKEQSAVYKLKEGNLQEQSLVADNHPSSDHKNRFIDWLINDTDYILAKERAN